MKFPTTAPSGVVILPLTKIFPLTVILRAAAITSAPPPSPPSGPWPTPSLDAPPSPLEPPIGGYKDPAAGSDPDRGPNPAGLKSTWNESAAQSSTLLEMVAVGRRAPASEAVCKHAADDGRVATPARRLASPGRRPHRTLPNHPRRRGVHREAAWGQETNGRSRRQAKNEPRCSSKTGPSDFT